VASRLPTRVDGNTGTRWGPSAFSDQQCGKVGPRQQASRSARSPGNWGGPAYGKGPSRSRGDSANKTPPGHHLTPTTPAPGGTQTPLTVDRHRPLHSGMYGTASGTVRLLTSGNFKGLQPPPFGRAATGCTGAQSTRPELRPERRHLRTRSMFQLEGIQTTLQTSFNNAKGKLKTVGHPAVRAAVQAGAPYQRRRHIGCDLLTSIPWAWGRRKIRMTRPHQRAT